MMAVAADAMACVRTRRPSRGSRAAQSLLVHKVLPGGGGLFRAAPGAASLRTARDVPGSNARRGTDTRGASCGTSLFVASALVRWRREAA